MSLQNIAQWTQVCYIHISLFCDRVVTLTKIGQKVRRARVTLDSSKPNWSWQYLITSMLLVLNSLIKKIVMTISIDLCFSRMARGVPIRIRFEEPFLWHFWKFSLETERWILMAVLGGLVCWFNWPVACRDTTVPHSVHNWGITLH